MFDEGAAQAAAPTAPAQHSNGFLHPPAALHDAGSGRNARAQRRGKLELRSQAPGRAASSDSGCSARLRGACCRPSCRAAAVFTILWLGGAVKKTRFCDPPRTAREALRWFSAPDGVQDRRCDQINPLDDPFVGARRRSIPASRSRVTMLRRDERGRRRRRFLHLLLRSCHDDGGPYSLRNGRPQPELSIFQRGAAGVFFRFWADWVPCSPTPQCAKTDRRLLAVD